MLRNEKGMVHSKSKREENTVNMVRRITYYKTPW
jgi:hypothetical protein